MCIVVQINIFLFRHSTPIRLIGQLFKEEALRLGLFLENQKEMYIIAIS